MSDRYERIRRNRRLVWVGIVVGYVLAAVILFLGLQNLDGSAGEVVGAIALAVSAGAPPTLALISLDRRSGLLPAASISALMIGFFYLILLFPWALVALIWAVAYTGRPVPVEVSRRLWWARVVIGLSVAVSVFVLFVHLDPVCTETLADGAVVEVDPATQGYPSGWRLGSPSSVTTSSNQSGPDSSVGSWCTSDTIVWGEALASLAVSLGAIGAVARWWPLNTRDPVSRPGDIGITHAT